MEGKDKIDGVLNNIKYLGDERRRHKRFPYTSEVLITHSTLGEHRGQILNMSAGGVFVVSKMEPAEGDKIELDLSLPGVKKRVSAEVRWVMRRADGYGFGVRFDHLPDEVLRAIRVLEQEEDLR